MQVLEEEKEDGKDEKEKRRDVFGSHPNPRVNRARLMRAA
jgi:hypothetical protein